MPVPSQCAWWGILGIWLFGGLTHQRCYDSSWNSTQCCNDTAVTCQTLLLSELSCARTNPDKSWEGNNYCPAGEVCDVRECFIYGILNYDNVVSATVMNFRLLTRSNNWAAIRDYEGSAGAWWAWYFVFPTFTGYYVVLLAMAVLLRNYTALSMYAWGPAHPRPRPSPSPGPCTGGVNGTHLFCSFGGDGGGGLAPRTRLEVVILENGRPGQCSHLLQCDCKGGSIPVCHLCKPWR